MAAAPEQSAHTSIKNRIYDTANRSSLESFVGVNRHSISTQRLYRARRLGWENYSRW